MCYFPLRTRIDWRIADHLEIAYPDARVVRELSRRFLREGYVKLRGLVPDDLFQDVSQEVRRGLDRHDKRSAAALAETGDPPRCTSAIGRAEIDRNGEFITAVYESPALREFLSRIAAEPVLPCPWEGERYSVVRQGGQGDAHEWHRGGFSFTVVWVIEAPPAEFGGQLQCVPDERDPRGAEHLVGRPVRTYGHVTGDLYFLRSDTTLQRIVPLGADRTRIILNTYWGSEPGHGEPAYAAVNAMSG